MLTRRFTWLQIVTYLGALAPLIVLIWAYTQGHLTANPIQDITLRTGKTALVLLVLSLACTPIHTLTGYTPVLKLRRPLGLYAFLYASLHFLVFSGLDYGFDLRLLGEAIFEKRFALVGFAALAILTPLAITSTRGWQRRLGKSWKRLHKWVYVAGLLVIVHYVWLVKSDVRQPLVWGAVVLLLLALRLRPVRHAVAHYRGVLRQRRHHDASGDDASRPRQLHVEPTPAAESQV